MLPNGNFKLSLTDDDVECLYHILKFCVKPIDKELWKGYERIIEDLETEITWLREHCDDEE